MATLAAPLRRSRVFLLASLVALAPLSTAWAQAGDEASRTATARALFDEGLSLLDREEWGPAADRFERALALRPSAQIAYNLSTALIAQGKLVRASEVLLLAARDETAPQQVRDAAERRRQEILPRLARLTVRVEGDRTDAAVHLDDRTLDWAMVGVAIPADPGHHEVTATRGEDVVDRDQVDLSEGGTAAVRLALPDVATPEEAAATVEPSPVAPVAPPVEDEGGSTWWIWAGLGVVVVGAAIVAAVLLGSSEPDPIQGSAGVVEL